MNLPFISFLKEQLSEMFSIRKKVVFIHQDQCCTSPLLEGLLSVSDGLQAAHALGDNSTTLTSHDVSGGQIFSIMESLC